MSDLRFTLTWGTSESGEPEVRATAAHLGLYVGDVNLTRNEDIWSKSVRENVFLAAYPLAQWLASSWWRLVYEPLPPSGKQPTHGWRMAHEVGAANHGFVWPNIVMACDTEVVQVWAAAAMSPRQSVQYLQSLPAPKAIPLSRFQRSIRDFIQATLTQLDAKALRHSDLAALWGIVLEDLADANAVRRRKLEAQLGFDPEECPPKALEEALRWGNQVGEEALSEIAPAIAHSGEAPDLSAIGRLVGAPGLEGEPDIQSSDVEHIEAEAPWQRAAHAARSLRDRLAMSDQAFDSEQLYSLLGLASSRAADWRGVDSQVPVAVAVPLGGRRIKFVPRKRNPQAKRFELARLLGDLLRPVRHDDEWLTSTDLTTARQKYQRAFAAELLCPIGALEGFLEGDYSASAIDDAAERFDVSEQVVRASLVNNGFLPPRAWANMPYRTGN